MSATVVLTTHPHAESARRVSRLLLEARLIACATLISGVNSLYYWDGAIQEDSEVMVIMKTTKAFLPALEERLSSLHPYEVPEVIAIDPSHVAPAYQKWLAESVGAEGITS